MTGKPLQAVGYNFGNLMPLPNVIFR